jgi:U11/U12 small nuclear ribonucleoprotein SNRNP35
MSTNISGGGFGGKKESGQLRFGGRDRPFRKPLPVPVSKNKIRDQESQGLSEVCLTRHIVKANV